ncbi:hypothetical protein [Deinococcus kurensis]|uniref:hypothetical protein n=1 Tax=Deinococcus kurensis TaxID=2662757 RepID=UPI0012D30860|nr:hypothetical protein [Deinococcus kurensis]
MITDKATDLLTRKFTQDRYGRDRELPVVQQRDRVRQDVRSLGRFRSNPFGRHRVRVIPG